MSITFAGLGAEEWIAISSAVIALCALGVSIWQGHVTRTHNHLAARPIVDINLHCRTEERIGICLKNCGPGPAFIQSVSIIYRRVRYNLLSQADFQRLINVWHNNGINNSMYSVAIPDIGSVLSSGEDYPLLLCNSTENRAHFASAYSKIFDEIIVEVAYKSLYDKDYQARYEKAIVNCA